MTTAPSASPPVEPSRLLQLPTELLLMILGEFDYHGLQRVRRVCKAFDTLVKDPKFDRVLFRQGVEPLKPGQKIMLHPLLDLVDCMWVTATRARLLYAYHDMRNVYDLSACDEFATSPACAELVLNVLPDTWPGQGDELVTSGAGLTVRDVLKAVAEYWDAGPGAGSVYMEHCEHAFTGWHYPMVLEGGRVFLEACGFDH
ncbi:hypothetical protein JCM9279_003792 [Rhodotorula babjevae]